MNSFQTPRTNHYVWSHVTGALLTGGPVSFAFYICRLASDSGTGVDFFPSSYLKYMAQELSSHIETMTRFYNDYGSINRDHAESNINSVNFPEFHSAQAENASQNNDPTVTQIGAKDSLLSLAQYERSCVRTSFQALAERLGDVTANGTRLRDSVGLFVDVSILYADVYEARDISNPLK